MIINDSVRLNETYDSGARFMDQAQRFINKNRNRTIKKSDITSIADEIGDVNPKLVNNFIELRKMDGVKIVDEAYTKPKVNPGTKYVMTVDDEVVVQFPSKQAMDQYQYNMSKNPNAFMGTFKKVVNGTLVPLNEDTVKTDKGWTNKGKSGKTHGYFKNKKDADAQRKAMFASGYTS